MPLPLLAAAGISLLPSAFKAVSGIFQSNKAGKLNPIDPGYQMNQNVIDNARILGDRYTNYQIPGYTQAQQNINTTGQTAFGNAVQGASSSGDILDAATKIAYGQNQANNQLAVQSAQGKEGALQDYLGASAAAGQQYVDKNAYDRQKYQQQLQEKAALTQAGAQNTYGALDSASSVATSFLMPQKPLFNPQDQNTGKGSSIGSIFDTQQANSAIENGGFTNMPAGQQYKNPLNLPSLAGYSRYNNIPR